MDAHELITKLGFPIFATLSVAGAFWVIVRWLMNNLTGEMKDIQDKLTSTQQEQMTILVRLIDRVRFLEDGITRVEMITRTSHELKQEWERIGRADKRER